MRKALSNKYLLSALSGVAAFLIYLPTLHNEFVNLDDGLYVYENPFIRSVDIRFLKWAFFNFYASNWHPLTWMSHALDFAIWGLNPLGHHLTNNILHAVNTFLVVLLVVKLIEIADSESPVPGPRSLDSLIAAGVTGLLFGLHPLHVESVAWVSERKDLLCALFFLLSVLKYMSYRTYKSYKTYFLFLFFFALALLSKPMAVSLPLVLLLLDWYPFERIRSLKTFRDAFVEKIPFVALSLISSVLTFFAQKTGGAMELIKSETVSTKVLVAVKSIIAYLWKMVLPVDLVPLYPYPKDVSLLSPEYFLPVFLAVGLTAVCLLAARKQKLWLSCWGYYVITLIPVLGVVQVGYQAMADRYTYLPSFAPFLLAGLATARVFGAGYASRTHGMIFNLLCATTAIVVVGLMSYTTLKQIGIWKNSITLWTYVIEKEPSGRAMAYSNRGSALNDMGLFNEAIEDYTKAIFLDPSYSRAYWSRGSVFNNIGRLDKAMEDLNKAIALEPSASAYYTRGMVFERGGEAEKAIGDYERAIALKPSYAAACFNLGVLYGKAGELDKAIEQFNKAIGASPTHSLAYGNRGLAYSLIGRFDKALQDLDRAVELNRRYSAAYVSRGNVYLRMGERELAVRDFRAACDLGDMEACALLGTL